jgi:hypothetical protein
MRLINVDTYALEEFHAKVPAYAILSHTWGKREPTLQDMSVPGIQDVIAEDPLDGIYRKIKGTRVLAVCDNLKYFWIDTACTDKSSSAELQEAINSMYMWYEKATVCYIYLEDFEDDDPWFCEQPALSPDNQTSWSHNPWFDRLAECRWFTRGWTLQEVLAPWNAQFHGRHWKPLGSKTELVCSLSRITRIPVPFLTGQRHIHSASIAMRMSWASPRSTTRKEDRAYSLLGLFGINIPMLYGEGSRAFERLREELIRTSVDQSIFAWTVSMKGTSDMESDLLAESADQFAESGHVISFGKPPSFEREWLVYWPRVCANLCYEK